MQGQESFVTYVDFWGSFVGLLMQRQEFLGIVSI